MQRTINDHFLNYIEDWNHYEYFLLGSYGSSKSFNTAIKLILKSLQEERRILVVRKVFATLKDSCYTDLKDAIDFLDLDQFFTVKKSPLEIRCNVTGSVFLFKGMDDKSKIKSIKDISICWIEENELSEDEYKELKDRMRTIKAVPHIIVTMNPASRQHWAYRRYIIDEGLSEQELYNKRIISHNNIYYHHSTYKDNYFLSPVWIRNLESEKNELLRAIKVKGEFGAVGQKIFTNIKQVSATEMQQLLQQTRGREYRGMDWGFSISYNALIEMVADADKKELYIFREYYCKDKTNGQIMEDIKHIKDNGYRVIADSAEPKTIKDFRDAGFRFYEAKKGAGSVKSGIRKLQEFDTIYISEECPNTYREFETLEHPKNERTSEIDEDKYNIDPHSVDAVRYGLEEFNHHNLKSRVFRKPIGL